MFHIFFLLCSLDMSRTLLPLWKTSTVFRVNLLVFLPKCLSFLKDFSGYRLIDKTVFFLQPLKSDVWLFWGHHSFTIQRHWKGLNSFPYTCGSYLSLLNFFFLKDSISCSLGMPQTDYIAKEDDSDPLVLLHLPPGCWDHRHEPPQQVYVVLGNKPRLWACLASILTAEPHVYTQDLAFVVENLTVVYASLGICYGVSRRAEERWGWMRAPGWTEGLGEWTHWGRLHRLPAGIATANLSTACPRDWWTTHKPSSLALIWSGIFVAAMREVTNSCAPTRISLASSYLGFI